MTDSGPLIVPIEVQAMVVNHANMNFVRATMKYRQLKSFASPSPSPFQNDAGNDFAAKPANQGVYLMWTLPKALRHGQENPNGGLDFPFVPNRWLVVRVYRPAVAPDVVPPAQKPTVAAWVVQSDFLDTTQGTSAFIDPTKTQTTPTLIGKKVSISTTAWQEPTTAPSYFLKAVSESNPAFAAYQPFNQNVFSIFDDLVTQQIDFGTISYFVLGWFSQPSADILSGWKPGEAGKDFPDLLNQLNWTATKSGSQSAKTSLYHGAAFGVSWQRGGSAPPSPRDGVYPQVALGNTSIDGVVTFARVAFEKKPGALTPKQAAEVLEAFQYNMLPMMDQPGAEAMLEQRIRSQWYGSAEAETTWTIVDAQTPSGTPPTPPTAEELAKEAVWLSALNQSQATFDQTVRELTGVQRDLFELWWKKGAANAYFNLLFEWPWTIESSDQLAAAMTPLITRAQQLTTQLQTLAAKIPTATAAVSLSQAIADFAKSKDLPPTRILKAVAGPRFWTPGDPIAVISNTAHLLKIDPDTDLTCRWQTELISQLNVNASSGSTTGPQFTISSAQLAQFLPSITWTNLPSAGQALFTEFFLLDPANARLVAAGAGQNLNAAQLKAVAASMSPPKTTVGNAPDILATYPWVQPWQPVYLDWAVQWFPIPFQKADGTPNWQFNGLDYDLVNRPAPEPSARLLSGRAVLTPKPSFEFKARIDQYIRDYPASEATRELKEIEDLVATVDGWDFLSQSFGGMQTQVSAWNPVPTMNPERTPLTGGFSLAELIGNQAQMPPNPVSYQAPPREPTPTPSTFEGMRGGQFYVNRLTIVDAFGQTLEVVFEPTPSDQFPRTAKREVFRPLLSDGVAPTKPLTTLEPLRYVQLPPRVLQPARLNFKFLPQVNNDPIVGWILPNHLDSGLAVYDRAGTAYGELTLGVDQQNTPVVNWIPAPGSPYAVLPAPAAGQGPLIGFLANLKSQGAKAFSDFLQAVDETLWTIDPLGNRSDAFLSVLIGRPLAIVTASVDLELQSDPWRDPDWPYTFSKPSPLFLKYKFQVRLGDLGYRQDGLIGYFLDGDYSHFNSIHLPDKPSSAYLKRIGIGNYLNLGFAAKGPGTPATLTMIMDPRGSVHAQCGFLPVKEVSLVPEWVDAALGALDVTFRAGPMLVSEQQVVQQGQTQPVTTLLLTSPAEKHGTWSWLQNDSAGRWSETTLAQVDSSATFPNVTPTLREGLLKLTGGLDE